MGEGDIVRGTVPGIGSQPSSPAPLGTTIFQYFPGGESSHQATTTSDISSNLMEAIKYRADADRDMAVVRANADTAIATAKAEADRRVAEAQRDAIAIPAKEETKREIGKTCLVVGSVAAVVWVATTRLSGGDLKDVLIACAIALASAWGVTEAVKAAVKRKTKELAPIK